MQNLSVSMNYPQTAPSSRMRVASSEARLTIQVTDMLRGLASATRLLVRGPCTAAKDEGWPALCKGAIPITAQQYQVVHLSHAARDQQAQHLQISKSCWNLQAGCTAVVEQVMRLEDMDGSHVAILASMTGWSSAQALLIRTGGHLLLPRAALFVSQAWQDLKAATCSKCRRQQLHPANGGQ